MKPRLITLLYEDKGSGGPNRFGLHELILQCVADQLQAQLPDRVVTRYSLAELAVPNPKNGNGNLRREIRDRKKLDRLAKAGPIFALFDSDRIRELLDDDESIPKDGCNGDQVRSARAKIDANHDRLTIWFLHKKTETVLEAIGSIQPGEKPDPITRDELFIRFLRSSDAERRANILDKVPTLKRFVAKLTPEFRALLVP
jgi:hypothetical protein